jgi:hypothetical protein
MPRSILNIAKIDNVTLELANVWSPLTLNKKIDEYIICDIDTF